MANTPSRASWLRASCGTHHRKSEDENGKDEGQTACLVIIATALTFEHKNNSASPSLLHQ